ncbi:hydrogen peroxide-inducible genes activator [Roseovarius mucosus]|uniref:Hydrogen peroxide-inducible genes activator n=1 Tax=Roseovarius mucosus TaxID=215743 RepID=A0A1V0RSR6_9RHOB|nr:hydrogen peroxide-inducible genes activator [Roseovarius mucosus]ARE84818.1 hydrogen peroxide-inducible genes activator [Roseovarius mucosus]
MAQDITLRQLRYFIALTETGHYRKAAERVGVSQPSLSQQILGLETALGMTLVERGHRGAILTPGGREVLTHARKMIEEAEVLGSLAQSTREGMAGTIRLGASPTLGPYFLPYVVRRLRRTYPGLKLIIRDAAPTVLQEELLEGRHDLILAQLPLNSSDIAVERLFREPLKLAVAQDHPLAGQASAQDADLAGQDILALPRGYPMHTQIVTLCEEVGAQLRQEYEGTSLDALRQMTALNMGICFLPALYVQSEVSPETGDVAILSFRQDRFLRSVGVAWRRRSAHGPMVERIVRVIREVARDRFAALVRLE